MMWRREWSETNDRFKNAVLYDTIGLAGQMSPVWDGICYDDSVELCIIQNGSLTGFRYKA